MPTSVGPTVVRRQLGRRLRHLRHHAHKTAADVAASGIASRAKLARIETGQTTVRVADVRALGWLYNADQKTIDNLAELAAGTNGHGWWEGKDPFAIIPDWFRLYVGLEAAARRVDIFEPLVVPGEAQTPDYARALFRAHGLNAAAADEHVRLRANRRETLQSRHPPVTTRVVIAEEALTRPVGGPDVLTEQIKWLHELSRGHLEVRVLPLQVGAHAAMSGAFRVLGFNPPDPDVAYVETQIGAHYLETDDELREYRRVFSTIYEQSVPIGDM